MVLEVLQVGLIVSIAAIIALSLLTLYLLDRLVTRVESNEITLEEIRTKEGDFEKQSDRNPKTEIVPKKEEEEPALEALERSIHESYERLSELVEQTAAKTKSLGDDLLASTQAMERLADSVSENKDRADVLQREISSITKRFDEIEDTLTEMVRRSLQSKDVTS